MKVSYANRDKFVVHKENGIPMSVSFNGTKLEMPIHEINHYIGAGGREIVTIKFLADLRVEDSVEKQDQE